jgi:glucose-6-phosphate isomerase
MNIQSAVNKLLESRLISRIWDRDYTLWADDPYQIVDRLGWLDCIHLLSNLFERLSTLNLHVTEKGITDVILIGMGGSSRTSEVLRDIFKTNTSLPYLTVLDTTVPAWIHSVEKNIDLATTLIIVASKSGETLETILSYRYFRSSVASNLGESNAGEHFIAITDKDSPLEKIAKEDGFLDTFITPSNVGGRFSSFTYFGLLPAFLIGIDIELLVKSARKIYEIHQNFDEKSINHAGVLGFVIGTNANLGVDKLTIILSESLRSFGSWLEQLIAESTGKNCKGVIPIIENELMSSSNYSKDRMFYVLRLKSDPDILGSELVDELIIEGRTVIEHYLDDIYDIGGEIFRWQFAVAVIGSVMNINPFNQPDVQLSKDRTARHLIAERNWDPAKGSISPMQLFHSIADDDYLALTAYMQPSDELEQIIDQFKYAVKQKFNLATSFGYGPRVLHSTGQLHKAGPNKVISIIIIPANFENNDLKVIGEDYTFGEVARSQAFADAEVLWERGRRVSIIEIPGEDEEILQELDAILKSILLLEDI